MKSLLKIAALALLPTLASAQSIDCPNFGKFELKGKTVAITYAQRLEFSDNNDIGNLMRSGPEAVEYQTRKWGTTISFPTALVNGHVRSAVVTFYLPEEAPEADTCTRK